MMQEQLNKVRPASALSHRRGGGVYLARCLACILGFSVALAAQATEWTYSATGNTITDGQWTLKVKSLDTETGTLGLSGIDKREDSTTSGIIDLRSPLVLKDSSDSSTIAINSVNLGDSAFVDNDGIYNITEFYCDIIGTLPWRGFWKSGKMTTIEIGGTAETLSFQMLEDCTNLKTINLNFPNLRKIDVWPFRNVNNANPIDISTIINPGVTNIGACGLACGWLRGDLVLTNVMFLGSSAFQDAALTTVFLTGSLDTLPSQVFRGTLITNVVLDLPNLATVDATAFGHPLVGRQERISRVEFVSAPKEMGLVTNIVIYSNNKDAPENLHIYVSKKQWEPSAAEIYDAKLNPTGFFSPLTDDEKAKIAADPALKKAFGVLVSTNGYHKAFFIHKPSIHDKPTGFLIRVCGAPSAVNQPRVNSGIKKAPGKTLLIL